MAEQTLHRDEISQIPEAAEHEQDTARGSDTASLRQQVMAVERAFAKTMAGRDHVRFAALLAAVVYPRGRACTADLVSQTFAPLATVAIDFTWTGEEHVVENGILVRQPLPPGTYRIVGGLGAVRPQGQPSEGMEFELLASASAP